MAAGEAQPGPREAEQIWAWSKANAARERKNGCGRVVMGLDKQTVAHLVDESSLMAPQRPETTKKRTKFRLREGRQSGKSVPNGVKMHFVHQNLFRGLEEVTTKKALHLDPVGRTGFHPAAAHKVCGRFAAGRFSEKRD